jgi:hypothetical protein
MRLTICLEPLKIRFPHLFNVEARPYRVLGFFRFSGKYQIHRIWHFVTCDRSKAAMCFLDAGFEIAAKVADVAMKDRMFAGFFAILQPGLRVLGLLRMGVYVYVTDECPNSACSWPD